MVKKLLLLCIAGMLALSGAATSFAMSDEAEGVSRILSKQCGSSIMTIRCSTEDAECTHTALSIKTVDGKVKVLGKPRGLSQYTAVGLACAAAKDHTEYFVVDYGEMPYGCSFCEWYHLYTEKGELLTHSDPAVLTDTSLPPTQQQYPNNKEFSELYVKLEFTRPKFDFLH